MLSCNPVQILVNFILHIYTFVINFNSIGFVLAPWKVLVRYCFGQLFTTEQNQSLRLCGCV